MVGLETSKVQFVDHLEALGIRSGAKLAVHSRLLSFGRIEGGVEMVFAALRDAVGPSGTLVFPTYTLHLDAASTYDPMRTPSRNAGALSEYARQRPEARRTLCPLHSHAVAGEAAEVVLAADPSRSLGPGSSFEVMAAAGFELLLLGCPFHLGATFVHHVEAMVGVPYREWVTLDRQVVMPDGDTQRMCCPYYGRRRDLRVVNDLRRCEQEVLADARVVSAPIGAGARASHLMALSIITSSVTALLARDPYALVAGMSEHVRAG